ncbi:MAG: hypothetical protein WD830_04310 [Chloroflexota bacterium]
MTHGRFFGTAALFVVLVMLAGACGTSAPPAGPTSSGSTSPGATVGTNPVSVGPIDVQPPVLDATTDFSQTMATSEADDRARSRTQAGFAREVGSGWAALSTAADDAIDAVALAMATEFTVVLPTTRGNGQFASVVMPDSFVSAPPASAASALAIVTASLTAGQALGQGGTRQASKTETRTTTTGDDVATVTVNMKGTITSTGSRVVAEFTFDLTGNVSNSVSGATAQMTGSATAHVEIDGCPDAGGSSKGKMSLTSKESVSGQHDGGDGTASWTRDLSGDFDIAVDDEANTSGVTMEVQANESVVETNREPGEDEPETEGHELGGTFNVAYSSGPGLTGLAPVGEASGDVSHERDATRAHLIALVRSAAYAISVAAFSLGRDAERFWRDGKCIEVIVAPAGGDVDANSKTDVVAKVKHRFEGNELTKPVEATLAGVKTIDPVNKKQPAPATSIYTAGPNADDKGDITFESVSNRGIGKKSVTFTVKPGAWTTNAVSPTGAITGTKCGGIAGDWTFVAVQDLSPLSITTTVVVTIDETTLEGTFNFHKDQIAPGSVTTHDSRGNARIVLNEDGSVTMTLDPAKITLHTETAFGSATVTIQGDKYTYPWTPAPAGACS